MRAIQPHGDPLATACTRAWPTRRASLACPCAPLHRAGSARVRAGGAHRWGSMSLDSHARAPSVFKSKQWVALAGHQRQSGPRWSVGPCLKSSRPAAPAICTARREPECRQKGTQIGSGPPRTPLRNHPARARAGGTLRRQRTTIVGHTAPVSHPRSRWWGSG
ncbi:hypothetical protein T492DRAFT_132631 [Pavlovales sp. CCMP2436]|nr:hypothetical protein T492DRAFT_132631 [Pavlovales sp. CCMP2436]